MSMLLRWLPAWRLFAPRRLWQQMRFAALVGVALLTPSLYNARCRQAVAQALCLASWRHLPGYLLTCTLLTAVLTRVMATTAESYGLSHLALEALVRVFVIELLPLGATVFVALRCLPPTFLVLERLRGQGARAVASMLPQVLGNALAVIILAVLGGILSLIVAYGVVFGLNPWGMPGYTRLLGQVFDPVLGLALIAKLLLFGMAVGIAPAMALGDARRLPSTVREMQVMVRLLLLLVLIEGSFLLLNIF